jgi:predicted site-specific integrase-resolvase
VRTETGQGKRLYHHDEFLRQLGIDTQLNAPRHLICHARVSSAHQSADLARQCADSKRGHPNHELIQDVASGLNCKRPGLLAILNAVCAGQVAEVIVAHRDRLAMGVEILEWIFARFNTAFVLTPMNRRASSMSCATIFWPSSHSLLRETTDVDQHRTD